MTESLQEAINDVMGANDQVQHLVSNGHFMNGTTTLLKALSDLDWAVRQLSREAS